MQLLYRERNVKDHSVKISVDIFLPLALGFLERDNFTVIITHMVNIRIWKGYLLSISLTYSSVMFIQPFVVFKPLAYLLSLSYQLWLTGSISYDYWWKGGQAWCWHFGWWSFSIIRLQCGRPGFNPWVGKIPWRRKWQPTPVFLPGESHGQRSLAGYIPWDRKSQIWLRD